MSDSTENSLLLFKLGAGEPRLQLFLFDLLSFSTEEETTVLHHVLLMTLEKVVDQVVQLWLVTIHFILFSDWGSSLEKVITIKLLPGSQ
jgi:hypothetical protein